MKKATILILTLILLIVNCNLSFAQKFDDIYYKYRRSENVTGVKIGGFMLSMLSLAAEGDEPETKEFFQRTKSIKILANEGVINKSLTQDVDNYLRKASLTELITVKGEDKEDVRIYIKQVKDSVKELFILASEGDEESFVIMVMTGDYPMSMVKTWIQKEGFSNIGSSK